LSASIERTISYHLMRPFNVLVSLPNCSWLNIIVKVWLSLSLVLTVSKSQALAWRRLIRRRCSKSQLSTLLQSALHATFGTFPLEKLLCFNFQREVV